MLFRSNKEEQIFIAELVPERSYMFDMDLKTGLSIVWNRGEPASFTIDQREITINKNCVIFLTEFHQIQNFNFERMNVIQFNRPFYCVQEDDDQVGCRGVLFFGASDVPKISIPKSGLKKFNVLWELLMMEMEEDDELKIEMLRTMLKRFLILSVRVYKDSGLDIRSDNTNVGLIREYNFLVEQHFREYTKVSDYARMLNKSPKTLSNIFKKYIDRSPLQIIHSRRLLEAKRLLGDRNKTIQEVAYELGYSDLQTFSHFFKKMQGIAPSAYKAQNKPE